jgi:hypothetical protein
MERELKFDGILYMKMKNGETEYEAGNRLCEMLENAGLCILDNYEVEVLEY